MKHDFIKNHKNHKITLSYRDVRHAIITKELNVIGLHIMSKLINDINFTIPNDKFLTVNFENSDGSNLNNFNYISLELLCSRKIIY